MRADGSSRTVYSVSIELNEHYRDRIEDEYASLQPEETYAFPGRDNRASYEEIRDFVARVIEVDLKDKLSLLADAPVTVRVEGARKGSIVLFFAVAGGLVDLVQITMWVIGLSRWLINWRLSQEYGDFFMIEVVQQFPHGRQDARGAGAPGLVGAGQQKSSRDLFFWYLFIPNVILMSVIVLLAVKNLFGACW
jgi:hypothetical protein